MILNMNEYADIMKRLNIDIIYSGPMWEDGIKGLSEMVRVHLSYDKLLRNSAKSIFSVFVEQVTNVLMYSADKKHYLQENNEFVDVSKGLLVLGHRENSFFIQTRNVIKNESVEFLKKKIDHLNTLDKKELRQYHKERLKCDNDNPDSKGAGLGLIEIARRASTPIGYQFDPIENGLSSFTMYVEIAQKENE